MSAAIRKGDTVRYVREFVVASTAGQFAFDDTGQGYQTSLLQAVTPPLPTTPGSVVKDEGCFLVLSTSGEWGCPDHGNSFTPDSRTQVIFDAGAA